MGLIVVLAIIAVIVIVKRIRGNDQILAPETEMEQNISGEKGEILPQ